MNEQIDNNTETTEKRGPGRPKRDATPVGAATRLSAPVGGAKARKRIGDNERAILPDTNGLDPNYRYYLANEGKNGTGIQGLLDRGYEIVQSDQSLVTEEAGKASGLSSQVQIVANESSGEKGVLLRIRKDYFSEDQADKQRVVDSTETKGRLISTDPKGQYAPKDESGEQVGIRIGR